VGRLDDNTGDPADDLDAIEERRRVTFPAPTWSASKKQAVAGEVEGADRHIARVGRARHLCSVACRMPGSRSCSTRDLFLSAAIAKESGYGMIEALACWCHPDS